MSYALVALIIATSAADQDSPVLAAPAAVTPASDGFSKSWSSPTPGRSLRLSGMITSYIGAGMAIGASGLWTGNEFLLDKEPNGGPHGIGVNVHRLLLGFTAVGSVASIVGNGLFVRGWTKDAVEDTYAPIGSPLYWLGAILATSAVVSTRWAGARDAAHVVRYMPLALSLGAQLSFLGARMDVNPNPGLAQSPATTSAYARSAALGL